MATFQPLSQAGEGETAIHVVLRLITDLTTADALHSTRLLTVEEKPFKRLTKRLLAPTSPIQSSYTRLPTPPAEPPSEDDTAAANEAAQQKAIEERQRFREDVILDFAAFESSLARIQFLRTSNEKERERYTAEKLKIEATAQAVKDNTAKLRVQLDEAQKTLAIRKTYDVLADKITSNKALAPRDEQRVNLEKLRAEIEDLERESKDVSQAWVDRRAQFGKIMDEGVRLRRLIRDEKEESEKQEQDDMSEMDAGRGLRSGFGTPRPDQGGLTPMHPGLGSGGALTPRSNVHGRRGASPRPDEVEEKKESHQSEDTDMVDEGEVEESTAPTAAEEIVKAEASTEKAADQMGTS